MLHIIFQLVGTPNYFEQSGWTLLMCTVEHENKEIMDILIANEADINYQCAGDGPLYTKP
ncbi:hypothetical protein [Paenibacillus xylanilyticus]|uniref:hypothetical protein n=1 Tax=Paenibacillus xylanilyticus TaxID=248903 RepID=UPI00399F1823